jgi:hypothetical protein
VLTSFVNQFVANVHKKLQTIDTHLSLQIPFGVVRLEWECVSLFFQHIYCSNIFLKACGHQGFDYFFESEPGAVQSLATRMLSDGGVIRANISTGRVSMLCTFVRGMANATYSVFRQFQKSPLATFQSSIQSRNHERVPAVNSDYLLLCIKESKFAAVMAALTISQVKSDLELFDRIRAAIYKKYSVLRIIFSLSTVKRIDFVKFAIRERSLVDNIRRNMLPPLTVTFYAFDPRKPKGIPPLGTNCLLHRFYNRQIGAGSAICLKQFPKRLKERPRHGQPPDNDIAWGLHIVEGPYFAKIMLSYLVMIAVGSPVFGVLYWCFEKDLSGAFGTAHI